MGNFLDLATTATTSGNQMPQIPNNGYLQSLRNIMASGGNPQTLLQNMMMKNPQMKQVVGMVQSNGGDWQKTFYQLAEQRGVNPDDVLRALKQ